MIDGKTQNGQLRGYIYISMCLLTELWPAPSCFFTFKWSLEDLYVPASMLSFREVFQKAHVDMILHKINNISVWWMQLYCKRKGNSFLSRVNRSTGSPESKSALHHDFDEQFFKDWTKGCCCFLLFFFFWPTGAPWNMAQGSQIWQKRTFERVGRCYAGLGVFIDNNARFFLKS